MLKLIKKNKLIISGITITSLCITGHYFYSKSSKKIEREKQASKLVKKLIQHEFEYYYSLIYHYNRPVVNFTKQLGIKLDENTPLIKNSEIIRRIEGMLSSISFSDYLKKIKEMREKYCKEFNVEYDYLMGYLNYTTKFESIKTEEFKETLYKFLYIRDNAYFGKLPNKYLNREILPKFMTPEITSKFSLLMVRLGLRIEIEFLKNVIANQKDEKIHINNILGNAHILREMDKKTIKAENDVWKFLLEEDYFGENWEENYEYHPLIYEITLRDRVMSTNEGFELLMQLKDLKKIRFEAVKDLVMLGEMEKNDFLSFADQKIKEADNMIFEEFERVKETEKTVLM